MTPFQRANEIAYLHVVVWWHDARLAWLKVRLAWIRARIAFYRWVLDEETRPRS